MNPNETDNNLQQFATEAANNSLAARLLLKLRHARNDPSMANDGYTLGIILREISTKMLPTVTKKNTDGAVASSREGDPTTSHHYSDAHLHPLPNNTQFLTPLASRPFNVAGSVLLKDYRESDRATSHHHLDAHLSHNITQDLTPLPFRPSDDSSSLSEHLSKDCSFLASTLDAFIDLPKSADSSNKDTRTSLPFKPTNESNDAAGDLSKDNDVASTLDGVTELPNNDNSPVKDTHLYLVQGWYPSMSNDDNGDDDMDSIRSGTPTPLTFASSVEEMFVADNSSNDNDFERMILGLLPGVGKGLAADDGAATINHREPDASLVSLEEEQSRHDFPASLSEDEQSKASSAVDTSSPSLFVLPEKEANRAAPKNAYAVRCAEKWEAHFHELEVSEQCEGCRFCASSDCFSEKDKSIMVHSASYCNTHNNEFYMFCTPYYQAFKSRHGHCNVPQTYKVNPELGGWLARQRMMMRATKSQTEPCSSRGDKTKQDRISRLKELGVVASIGTKRCLNE